MYAISRIRRRDRKHPAKKEKTCNSLAKLFTPSTSSIGMTLAQRSLHGDFGTINEQLMSIVQYMAQQLQKVLHERAWAQQGCMTYKLAKKYVLSDAVLQQKMLDLATRTTDPTTLELEKQRKLIREIIIRCVHGRINAFHINKIPKTVTMNLRDKLKPCAQGTQSKKSKKKGKYSRIIYTMYSPKCTSSTITQSTLKQYNGCTIIILH